MGTTWRAKLCSFFNNLFGWDGTPPQSPPPPPPDSCTHTPLPQDISRVTLVTFQKGKPCRGAQLNMIRWSYRFHFNDLLLANPLRGGTRPLLRVNAFKSAAFLQAKRLLHMLQRPEWIHSSAHTLFPVVFGLGRPFTSSSYMPASRLGLIWEGDVHNLLYMYCFKSET